MMMMTMMICHFWLKFEVVFTFLKRSAKCRHQSKFEVRSDDLG